MAATERKFLIFEVQGVHYALDLAHIAEVVDPPRSSPIPLAPACFIGAIHLHGAIVAAIDLALFWGQPKCREPGKLIVLNQNVAAMAFLVDRVIRIVPAGEVEIHDSSGTSAASLKLLPIEREAMLLDMDVMVKAVENMMI